MAVNITTHSLTETSWSSASNSSQVRYLVQLTTTGASYNDNNITTTYVIGGTTYTNTHKLPTKKTTTIVDNTVTIYHNADGTGSVNASFSCPTRISAGTITGSKSLTLTTIPRYATITAFSISAINETTIRVNWGANATCDSVAYSLDGGGWVYRSGTTFDITGVSAGVQHSVRIGVRRQDSQLWSYSDTKYVTTYAYPYVSSAPSFVVGNTLTIGLYNPLGRSIDAYAIGNDGTQKFIQTLTGTSISGFVNQDWQDFWYSTMPNSSSGTYKIRLVVSSLGRDTTTSGSSYSVNSSSVAPIFTTFDYEDVNATTLALTGNNKIFIPKYSNLKVTISDENKAVAQNFATMQYYNIAGTNFEYTSPFEATINNYEQTSVKVFAIDSRNLSTLAPEQPLNTLNYNVVQKGTNEYSRSGQGVGTQVTFVFRGSFWKENFGQVNNELTATYRFKKTNESNWTTGTSTISISSDTSGTFNYSGILAGDTSDNGFDVESSYNVEIIVSDKLSSVTYSYTIIEGSPAIDLYGNCVSLGSMYDEQLGGRVQINGLLPLTRSEIDPLLAPLEEVEYIDTTYGRTAKFKSGLAISWGYVSIYCYYAAWGNLYAFDATTNIPFGITFIQPPHVAVNNVGSVGAMIFRVLRTETAITQISFTRPTSYNEYHQIDYIAIGRWK